MQGEPADGINKVIICQVLPEHAMFNSTNHKMKKGYDMQALKMLFLMLIFVLIVGFITQNQWMLDPNHFVQFRLSSYRTIPTPIPLVMALCVLVGAIIIFFTMFLTQLRLKQKVREQVRTIQLMEKEINELRNLPITEIEEDIDESAAAIEEYIE